MSGSRSPFGVYVHFPWCRSRCHYCDFAVTTGSIQHESYERAVVEQLKQSRESFSDLNLETLYVGGGTPSLWNGSSLGRVVEAICNTFDAEPEEVSLEVNPSDCSDTNLEAWKKAGVNRLSMGLQSFSSSDLVTLGRSSDMGHSTDSIQRALSAGFESLSVDLMLGIPGSTHLIENLRKIIDLNVPHISVYELTVEANTRLAQNVSLGKFVPLDEDALAEQLLETRRVLAYESYDHYEVSSFCKGEHVSKHNMGYWKQHSWLGLGVGATSQRKNDDSLLRWKNAPTVKSYLSAESKGQRWEEECLNSKEAQAEKMWLGLRTNVGIHRKYTVGFESALVKLLAMDLIETLGETVVPTPKGLLYSNEITRRVLSCL